jgi:hypothetical protein
MSEYGWIGVDLDGTLAEYDDWKGMTVIGDPIMPMVDRVRQWIEIGVRVKIFTARICRQGVDREIAEKAIREWCLKHIGYELEVTNVKDFAMIELWDDRAVQVIKNIGIPVIGSQSRARSKR